MKKFVLAAVAALTLGMGVASAAVIGDGSTLGRTGATSHWSIGGAGQVDTPNG
ncbi:MAG TPA: hypothetical protein VMB34_11345 [Acetobacteraceae bacterium]|nr:hypothetical protein [Acetobacteraceae bacterium]